MLNREILVPTAVGLVLLLGLIPAVHAAPVTASLSWSPVFVPVTTKTTATAGVSIDSDCPAGYTYSGTITVIEPDGVSTATFTVLPTPCGTSVTAVYPTDFTGTASTTPVGTFTATFAGTTSFLVGGFHPSFSLTDNFFTGELPPPPVPEFPVPAILMAAFALLAIVAMRKTGRFGVP